VVSPISFKTELDERYENTHDTLSVVDMLVGDGGIGDDFPGRHLSAERD
jgi:hypothetical protein